MTKHFKVSKKILKHRYNGRMFIINLLPLCVVTTIAGSFFFSKGIAKPVLYYYVISIIMTCCVGFSFFTLLIGSIISRRKQENHYEHTYVEISGNLLLVSKYVQSLIIDGERVCFKKLYIINLEDITDIYYYKKNLIVISPARMLFERAEWLTYQSDSFGINFDRWWYDKNGGDIVNGVAIKNMFINTKRIARTISNASGKIKERFEERNKFREKMLSIAQYSASKRENYKR